MSRISYEVLNSIADLITGAAVDRRAWAFETHIRGLVMKLNDFRASGMRLSVSAVLTRDHYTNSWFIS